MDENIIVSEEITETTGEIIESAGSGNGLKTLGVMVLIAGVAYGGYRLAKKIKSMRAAKKDNIQYIDDENTADVDED